MSLAAGLVWGSAVLLLGTAAVVVAPRWTASGSGVFRAPAWRWLRVLLAAGVAFVPIWGFARPQTPWISIALAFVVGFELDRRFARTTTRKNRGERLWFALSFVAAAACFWIFPIFRLVVTGGFPRVTEMRIPLLATPWLAAAGLWTALLARAPNPTAEVF